MTRILITGFGVYGEGSNASERLIEALRRADLGIADIRLAVLPVDTEAVEVLLAELIESSRPDFALFFGQAPGRNRIMLERIATNLRDLSVPDVRGRQPRGEPVVAGGPDAYRATLPDMDGMVAALNAAGIPAGLSNHAGNHLCNQTLYLGLHFAARCGLALKAGFVHIPAAPEQIIAEEPLILRHPNCPYVPTATAVEATRILIRHLASRPAAEAARNAGAA